MWSDVGDAFADFSFSSRFWFVMDSICWTQSLFPFFLFFGKKEKEFVSFCFSVLKKNITFSSFSLLHKNMHSNDCCAKFSFLIINRITHTEYIDDSHYHCVFILSCFILYVTLIFLS